MKHFVYLVMLLVFSSMVALAGDFPTSLACSSNAKTWRDYGFTEKEWSGTIPSNPSQPFGVSTKSKPNDIYVLRDKVFSSLNTKNPMIRSITPGGIGQEEQAAEFKGTVVGRTADAIFILWSNEINKYWLAAIDLNHRKATVSQVFRGVTSIGGEIETLDCR